MAGIGGRIGATTVFNLIHVLCVTYQRHAGKILQFVADTNLIDSGQKTTLTAFLNSISGACEIVDFIRVVWES